MIGAQLLVWFCLVVVFTSLKGRAFLHKSTFIDGNVGARKSSVSNAIKDPEASKEGRKLTPAQRAIQESVRKDEFDSLKQVAYGAVDGFQRIGGEKETKTSKSFVVDGYSDLRKRATPTEKLVKAMKDPRITDARPSLSVFDSVKGAVYGTADMASSIGKIATSGTDTKSTETVKQKVPNKRTISQEIVDSIPDLNSANPIKRWAAEAKLKNVELEEQAKMKQKELQESIDKVKRTVYTAGDFVNESIETVNAFPGKVMKVSQEITDFFASVPGTVEKTVDEVTAIPSKVEAKVNEVRKSVDETIDRTKKVIEDVKAIPGKVQESVENTKKTIDMTVQTVEEAKTNTKILLGLEKPKPKPPSTPPPKPPTAGDFAFKIMGSVASTAGKAFLWVGKGAADMTVMAAKSGFDAIKESATKQRASLPLPAIPKITAPAAVAKVEVPSISEVTTTTPSLSEETSIESSKSSVDAKTIETQPKSTKNEIQAPVNDISDTDELEQQVAEALKLAEEALQVPSKAENETRSNRSSGSAPGGKSKKKKKINK